MKWLWMMSYCKKRGISPAQSWAWKEASIAYDACMKSLATAKRRAE